ncbi:unnamed protein product, partial [Brassica rapa]
MSADLGFLASAPPRPCSGEMEVEVEEDLRKTLIVDERTSGGCTEPDELEMQLWSRRCIGIETGPGRSEKQNSMQRSS